MDLNRISTSLALAALLPVTIAAVVLLLAVKASLLADLLQEREAEATWVVTRAAELCEWASPDLVETGIRFDSKTRSAP